MTRPTLAAALSLLAAAAVALGGQAPSADPGADTRSPAVAPVAQSRDERPDIVLVVTDDQRAETLRSMPKVQRLLVSKGTKFSHAMVPTALCCPSRSSILTGLFSHRTRVYGNGRIGGDANGGWAKFRARGLEKRTIATALQAAGYRTGLFGKYLNEFGNEAPKGYRPPGWDSFLAFQSPNAAYYQYRLTDGTWHGAGADDYSTDVLAGRAVDFVRTTPRKQPLLLLYTPYGPHRPYASAPRHAGRTVTPARTYSSRPSLADVLPGTRTDLSPMPPRLPGAPAWTVSRHLVAQDEIGIVPEAQTRALLAVDDAVADLVRTLRETGRLRNTLFVFMSDNGYLWGEHGMVGKDAPYAPATRVPMVIRWDRRVPAGVVDDRLALNVDLAPTFARVARARMSTEGQDLLSPTKRDGFVLEGMQGIWNRPPYCGWRTKDWMYVHYSDGSEELYDYRTDPGEMHNLAGMTATAGIQAQLRAQAVQACRPVPPGFHWSTPD